MNTIAERKAAEEKAAEEERKAAEAKRLAEEKAKQDALMAQLEAQGKLAQTITLHELAGTVAIKMPRLHRRSESYRGKAWFSQVARVKVLLMAVQAHKAREGA